MVEKKTRIVIIGAGMAGLTAANKLYTSSNSKDLFEISVVEGGTRIGGRINTSNFMGERIEMGATWIHGINGSPIHKIAQEINALNSDQPWECMDNNSSDKSITVAENGFELNPSIVKPVTCHFNKLMDFAQGKENKKHPFDFDDCDSVGSFLRKGLDLFWDSENGEMGFNGFGEKWEKKSVQEGVFAMHENTQRTYTSAGELSTLDFNAESEYQMFPGEEITIAKGYLSIIESITSVLPPGLIQLGKKVTKIEWQPEFQNGPPPVKIQFSDGGVVFADHVIVTVSLGVLKAGIQRDSSSSSGMYFDPPLPSFKTDAISRLGFGVVNKLFLQLGPAVETPVAGELNFSKFPFLNFVFHRVDSELRDKRIPWWMRRTASLHPIHQNSSVLLSWFAGEEALQLEKLNDEEIINGVSTTISNFLPEWESNSHSHSHGELKIRRVLKSKWGNDPLFQGSYSYVAVGSSGEDLDSMAEPLPRNSKSLQILFAGEATHRTHYSTTHGAYFSGLREANRLLQHYNCV